MILAPTFYFRPLSVPIVLSHSYNISLRNPLPEEIPLFEQSVKVLSDVLSDKEKRRILYTLYPFGIPNAKGTITEQFIHELAKIWVIAQTNQRIPLQQDLIDYGYLCGYISDQTYVMSPNSFIGDIKTMERRELFRALKRELPKASVLLANPHVPNTDLQYLENYASCLESLLVQNDLLKTLRLLAQHLRQANTHDVEKRFLQYTIACEVLLVGSNNYNKVAISRQFSSKLALIRHLSIKNKQENILYTPMEMQLHFNKIYSMRSTLLHGRDGGFCKKQLAHYTNILFHTLRLGLNMLVQDPQLLMFLRAS